MLNQMTFQPTSIQFAARRKAAPQPTPVVAPPIQQAEAKTTQKEPLGLPLYYLVTSGGDGSFSPHFFSSKAERDKALEWVEENDPEPVGDSDGSVEASDVYRSAKDFIEGRE